MDRQEIPRAVEAERLDLADLLDRLTPADWDAASLAVGWTVRDVVAHLTIATRLTRRAAVAGMLRARGDINRMIGDAARRRSGEFAPAELVAQLRATAGSPRRPLGTHAPDPLVDMLVHGQDIARPLGRERGMPVERVVPALDHAWGSSFYGARKRFAGLRLVATDADWSGGDGPQAQGPAGELLLLVTGRPAGVAGVTGPGRDAVAARLTP